MEELVLDGNAIGGLLGEVFAVDVTAAGSRCSGCGARAEVGALRAYVHAMGAVVRCPGCDGVLMNTAIAGAKDPVAMAIAMRLAVEAGRLAFKAGRIGKKLYATASSPIEGVPDWSTS